MNPADIILNTFELTADDKLILEALEKFDELSVSLCFSQCAIRRLLSSNLIYRSELDVVRLTERGQHVVGTLNV